MGGQIALTKHLQRIPRALTPCHVTDAPSLKSPLKAGTSNSISHQLITLKSMIDPTGWLMSNVYRSFKLIQRFGCLAVRSVSQLRPHLPGERYTKYEKREPQFTKWVLAHKLLPAWKALTFPARDAYSHLQVRCYAEPKSIRNNNGEVYRSLRCLSGDMGCSVKTAGAALADLQAKGWIICTTPWQRGTVGKGKTATFRLTMLPTKERLATREPEKWTEGQDYPVTVYRSYTPKLRTAKKGNLKK